MTESEYEIIKQMLKAAWARDADLLAALMIKMGATATAAKRATEAIAAPSPEGLAATKPAALWL